MPDAAAARTYAAFERGLFQSEGPDRAPALSRAPFPPRRRPEAALGVLDISEYFCETSGGVRTYLLNKGRYVEARPALRQVLVVPGASDRVMDADGVRCYRLRGPRIPTRGGYRFLLAMRSTARIVAHERPDLIEIGSAWTVPWLVRHAVRGQEIPLVLFCHDNFPRLLSPPRADRGYVAELAWRYMRAITHRCRAVLAPSMSVARDLERHGVERVVQVSLGVDLGRFHPSRRERASQTRRRLGLPDAPIALFVGRFGPEKQLQLVLDAWPAIARRTGAHLVLVGSGPDGRRLLAQSRGPVTWLPFEHDRDRLADLYAAADVCLSPGRWETFGLAALEALASGTPVVTADEGGVAELVARSGAGAAFASGDSGALVEAAVAVLRGNVAAFGERGRRYAEAHHAWPVVLDRIFEVYRGVLGQ